MIKTKCLSCGCELIIGVVESEGYFLGYDTAYYGDSTEEKDPHEIIGHYCYKCGDKLRKKAEAIKWERIS